MLATELSRQALQRAAGTLAALAVLILTIVLLPDPSGAAARCRRHGHGCGSHRSSAGSGCAGADEMPTPDTLHRADMATLCLVNAERAAAGLRPLRSNPQLHNAARGHSDSMVALDYFDHTSPNGATLLTRVFASGYAGPADSYVLGENIALGTGRLGTPRSIVASWMRSPGHRDNILSTSYRDTGIGIAPSVPSNYGSGGGTYTEDFGTVNGH